MTYLIRDVTQILGLSRAVIMGLVGAGFVNPKRGKRHEYRFDFQDLILLRSAQGLAAAKLPTRRILRLLRALRERLPAEPPLDGMRIAAVGSQVTVQHGPLQWTADSGQYLLNFEVAAPSGEIAFFDPAAPEPATNGEEWFLRGCEFETTDVDKAIDAYRRAIQAYPCHSAAHTNLGRLLHEAGRLADAEAVFRQALESCGPDALLLFNLAVVVQDLARTDEAIALYRQTLAQQPGFADAHYNLGLLYEAQGRAKDALRHFNAYRKLGATP